MKKKICLYSLLAFEGTPKSENDIPTTKRSDKTDKIVLIFFSDSFTDSNRWFEQLSVDYLIAFALNQSFDENCGWFFLAFAQNMPWELGKCYFRSWELIHGAFVTLLRMSSPECALEWQSALMSVVNGTLEISYMYYKVSYHL